MYVAVIYLGKAYPEIACKGSYKKRNITVMIINDEFFCGDVLGFV